MKPIGILLCLAAVCLAGSGHARAEDPPLSILVRPAKEARDWKYAGMVASGINRALMRSKHPKWLFYNYHDFDNLGQSRLAKEVGLGKEGAIAVAMGNVDILIEVGAARRKAADKPGTVAFDLTIRVTIPSSGKLLYASTTSGTPRLAKSPGEVSRAVDDAREKATPALVSWLQAHYRNMIRHGRWCRVILRGAPRAMVDEVERSLRGMCHQVDRDSSANTMDTRCKKDDIEIRKEIFKVIGAWKPPLEYETKAGTRSLIELLFKPAKKKRR
jgi:hypothetical protein